MSAKPIIEAFFDEPTNTISYLVVDPASGDAAVIDPVLDFDMPSGAADTRPADRILPVAAEHDWPLTMVLDTPWRGGH